MEFDSLDAVRDYLPKARVAFERQVEVVAVEVTAVAKQISSALGDVSMDELKSAIIREFTSRMLEPVGVEDADRKR